MPNNGTAYYGFGVDRDPVGKLYYAISFGTMTEVESLVQSNPDLVHQTTTGGTTALHVACHNTNMVRFLLECGASINARDDDGRTPLFRACQSASPKVAELLMLNGADPLVLDAYGWSPLVTASSSGRGAVVRCLLRHQAVRASIDAQDSGRTALWRAAYAGISSVVRILLEAGADPWRVPVVTPSPGLEPALPAEVANFHGHHECFQLLVVSVLLAFLSVGVLGRFLLTVSLREIKHVQDAEKPWEIRRLMRHVIEVALVAEERELWAKNIAEERRLQSLAFPAVAFADYGVEVVRGVLERLDRQIAKRVVSFV